MPDHATEIARFGVFEFHLHTAELRKGGAISKLPPQPSKLLTLLVTHAGELVTREQIRQHLWGNDTFVDFEQGLNHCIRQIRSELNDFADHLLFIQTVPRR